MATSAAASGESTQHSGAVTITALIDRWIYVFMAALFFVTTLAGFVPDSLEKIGAVQAGARPPFPPILHVHAVLMGSWLTLLLVQTTLMATGRNGYHRQLGLIGFVLAPAIVLAGIVLIPRMFGELWFAAHHAPPAIAAQIKEILPFATDILLFQIRVGVLFPIMVGIALYSRRHDVGLHKRLIILATLLPLPAAIDRMHWLPSTLPASPLTIEIYSLLWMAPMLLWDLFRQRKLHRAYVIWFALNLPFIVAAQTLWGSDWWQAAVPRLLGLTA